MQATNTWLEEYNMIKAVLAGDKQQYLELVRRYQKPVFGLHCRITNSKAQAEELTCHTFVKAYHNLRKFNFSCKFENWVYVMGLYLALDFMKAKGNMDEPADSMYFVPEENRAQFWQKAGQRLMLRKAIAQLGRKQQAILYLKYFEDLAYEEISEKLGRPENKVKAIVYKTRKHLKNKLSAWGYFS
ncbi:MAG: sigma-70 family RNA polymerase sigma factor [Prevotellaceae bacterium]|jgi:RNA polymerase sigma-70 factor (ECF subfamily)|nr:sigma-70 family RNA polymerase sigma factor [Prevotellaceae bacterium]